MFFVCIKSGISVLVRRTDLITKTTHVTSQLTLQSASDKQTIAENINHAALKHVSS